MQKFLRFVKISTKALKVTILHPRVVAFALTHSRKETYWRYKRLEALISTPKAAFHGDGILQRLILSSIEFLEVKNFVETGTFRGDSIIWLSRMTKNLKIISCEVDDFYYKIAAKRISRMDIDLYHCSSPLAIHSCFERGDLKEPTFFWLDAHWEQYWPLLDELREILHNLRRGILMIDDFRVPDRPEFEYDIYETENSLEYITPLIQSFVVSSEIDFLFPNYDHEKMLPGNNKKQRGYVAIFVGIRKALDEFLASNPEINSQFARRQLDLSPLVFKGHDILQTGA